MKMKWKMILSALAAMTLLMIPSASVSAQTITLDTDGPEYTGDYLLTWNTFGKVDYLTYNGTANPDQALDDSWEKTGIIGAAGADGAVKESTVGSSEILSDVGDMLNLTGTEDGSLTGTAAKTYHTGDTLSLTTYMYYGQAMYTPAEYTAECVAVTDSCTLWYNTAAGLENAATKEDIISLAPTLQACADRMKTVFGDSDRLDTDQDGKVAFVFYPMSTPNLGGFFFDGDLTLNQMDMLNLNIEDLHKTGEGMKTENLMGILVHEWQHLINKSQTGGEMNVTKKDPESQYSSRTFSWLGESFSQSSAGINGYAKESIKQQIAQANDFLNLYDQSLSMPFAFQGIFVPGSTPLRAGIYTDWYLFGRYLSAQTEGYTGGGDEIYKTIFNTDRENFEENGETYTLGKCDSDTAEKALTAMGYLGTGENAKAGDFSEMLRNFVLATYFRQDSGVYSLGGLDGIDLSSIEIPKACTATQTPQKLPGGYSACLTKINCTGTIVVNEEADGADIRHAGIKITYDGVKDKVTKNADGSRTFTLTTTDKNAKIYYTVNGDLPDTDNGILYSGPFTLPKDMPVHAISADEWGKSNPWYYSTPLAVTGFNGSDRYSTAAKLMKNEFPDGADTAILASGENWPDALTATALAGAMECPLLVTQNNTLTQTTSDLIYELGITNVRIIGGTDVVSQDVEDALTTKNGIPADLIDRIKGDTRVETAEEVEKAVMALSPADTCFICSGNNFPDALSVAPYAYQHKVPILLTQKDSTLSPTSLSMAKEFSKIYIIGERDVVSQKVEDQLSSAGAVVPTRLGGKDRYATCVAVDNEFFPESLDLLTIVTGENFPDALTAAVYNRDADCALLLVNGDSGSMTEDQASVIERLHNIDGASTAGGDGALSSAARTAIDNAVIYSPLEKMSTIYSYMMERKTTAEPVLRTVDEFPGLICQKCSFSSYQGAKLAGYKYSREGIVPKGVIIMAHGLGPGGQCVYMDQADYFTSNGYLVFAYDAIGNDASAGDSCIGMQQGILDLDRAISFVQRDSVMKSLPIGLYGHSWGAYCVSAVLQMHPEVKAVAEISGFSDSQDLIKAQLGDGLVPYYSWYIEWQLFGSYSFYTGMDGFDSTEADIMVIHSEDDQNVPISTGYDLYYDKYKDDSRFTFQKYTDRGHLYIFYTDAARKYDEAYDAARAAYFEENGLQNTTENRDAYYADHPFDKKTGFELDTTFMGNILAFFDKNIGG